MDVAPLWRKARHMDCTDQSCRDGQPKRAARARSGARTTEPVTALAELETGAMTAHIVERGMQAAQPAKPAERPNVSGRSVSSVLCAADRTANDRAARHQAELLASPERTVELVSTSQLTRHGHRARHDGCEGHDLLALGAGPAAYTAVQHAPIPTLVARWCPFGTEVTDTVLVPVDASTSSSRAVALAGRLAAAMAERSSSSRRRHAMLRSSEQSPPAAASLRTTGRRRGEQLPRERLVPPAAAALTSLLVVLGSGDSEIERSTSADIVGALGCSALVAWPGSTESA